MIGYCMLGTNDVARAKAFYDPIATLLGASVLAAYSSDRRVFYTAGAGAPMFAITMPYDGKAANVGNGTMVALPAPSRAIVDEVHAKALALGGKDEGAPPVCVAPTWTDFMAPTSVIRMGTSSASSASVRPDTEWRESDATRR